jgi:malate dehydrogenase
MTVITKEHVDRAEGELVICAGDIITPLALDRAKELGIRVLRADRTPAARSIIATTRAPATVGAAEAAAPPRPVARPTQPPPAVLAPVPNSGALYRRGAPLRIDPRVTNAPARRPADARGRLAVVGAGHVGATTAFRLAEADAFAAITLIDVVPGLAAGLALDMWHSAGLRGFTTRLEGSDAIDAVTGADVIIVTAGRPRQPGMSRTDLTGVNAGVVSGIAGTIRRNAPDAIVIVVTNPLEEMTHLMCRETGFAPERVIGMAGVLDTARFCALVGLTGIARPRDVSALALGSHGTEMVIPLSQATANGKPLEQQLDRETLAAIVERTRESGAEVVRLLQKGSAYFSPAESAARMVDAIVRDSRTLMTACVRSRGVYGLSDTRVGLPVRLGRAGVAEIVELPLRPDELQALSEAANRIAERIRELG